MSLLLISNHGFVLHKRETSGVLTYHAASEQDRIQVV